MTVASTLFVVLFLGAWRLFTETAAAVYFSQVNSDLDTSMRRVLDRIWSELRDSGTAPLDPSAVTICHSGKTKHLDPATAQFHLDTHPNDYSGPCTSGTEEDSFVDYVASHSLSETTSDSSVTFQARGETGWGTPVTYSLAPSLGETPGNGIDEDGDTLVDEQTLVRTQDNQTAELADNVLALNFSHVQGEHMMRITLTMARPGRRNGEVWMRNLSTVVAYRNRTE
jgi:hypothetical protein